MKVLVEKITERNESGSVKHRYGPFEVDATEAVAGIKQGTLKGYMLADGDIPDSWKGTKKPLKNKKVTEETKEEVKEDGTN